MIIFLFGRSGSGKSAIVQNLIPRLTAGEEIDAEKLIKKLICGQYKFMKKPVFVTSTAPTKDHRDIFHNTIKGFTGLSDKTFSVYVHASQDVCEYRLRNESRPKLPHNPLSFEEPEPDEFDLMLRTEAEDVEKNAGFLGLFTMSRYEEIHK